MQIDRVEIENFRSIRRLQFTPRNQTILIGQNNAGKSNILRALNLVLGEAWPSERHFSEDDFFNRDTSQDILIKVFFDGSVEVWRNNSKCAVAGFLLRCHAYKRKTGKKLAGDLNTEYVCIDQKGKKITYPEEPLRRGQQFRGAWLPLRVTSELRDSTPFIYIDVNREYGKHSPRGRWSILRRLFKDVQTQLVKDKKTIDDIDDKGLHEKVTRIEAYRRRLDRAFDALRSGHFDLIETTLEKHALEFLGFDSEKDQVRLGFDPMDPENIFRSIQLYVTEGDFETPAEEVGSGLQSAIVVAIFRTYQELQREGAIFAIEEPEVFLHPHRARFFNDTLRGLADSGNQVFVSTHSPLFVPLDRFEEIALVRKESESGTYVVQTDEISLEAGSKEFLRLITEFDSHRSEMFFANKVLLVEGYTERLAFPLVFKTLGVDINREAISVVECQGKTKIPLFVEILKALKIAYLVVHDEDLVEIDPEWPPETTKKARNRNKQHQRWNKAIAEAVGDDPGPYVLTPDFEGVCGLPRREQTKLQRALERFENADVADIPETLIVAARALLEL